MKAKHYVQRTMLLVALSCALAGCPCIVVGGPGEPSIKFTSVPQLNSTQNLAGRVRHVRPCDYAVAVYIFVGNGWWNKPTFAEPLTSIGDNGTWKTDITTGGADQSATKIAAFLVPKSYSPPLLSGATTLPAGLQDAAVAHVAVERGSAGLTRLVYFSGYEWWVKSSEAPVGPGPNIFSDSVDNVRVDRHGQLHLRITNRSGVYRCAEIVSRRNFGYGTYTFTLASPVNELDPNVTMGLFTWSDDPEYHYREMDIEFSRWQDPLNENAQFVVQPWDLPGNMERFEIGPDPVTSHIIQWEPEQIGFQSTIGDPRLGVGPNDLIHEWQYAGDDNPVPGSENIRMNLWLVWGESPSDGQETEVIVRRFEFAPVAR